MPIRRYLVSRACDSVSPNTADNAHCVTLALSAVLSLYVFSVFSSVCFSSIYRSIGRTSMHCSVLLVLIRHTQYRTSDVAENLGRYLSNTERTSQGKDFEFILTVKMDTRHPVRGLFLGNELSAPVIIAELWLSEVARPWKILWAIFAFFKQPLTVKFSKFCSESLHGNTDWRCCVKMS